MMRKFWFGLAVTAMAASAAAEVPGVDTLMNQAAYWQGKGRQDLAAQAFRRVLAVDPGNAAARRGLAGDLPLAGPPAAGPP
ncbi:MAG: hypothetical protein DCF31_00665, partial [Alphaproteobacteria bacterium]